MELMITLVIWAVILLVALHFAQIMIGLVIWIFIGLFALISWPLTWAYDKIKGVK